MQMRFAQTRFAKSWLGRPLFTGIAVGLFLLLVAPSAILADVKIDGQVVRAETKTLTAVFERGVLTSLVRKSDAKEVVHSSAKDKIAVYLIYPFAEAVPLGKETTDSFIPHRINDHRVEVRIQAYDGDGILTISDDPETGDVIVEPNAYTSRPGMRSVRWMLSGIDPTLNLIAPFFQGIDLPLEDPLIKNSYWYWPHRWEAGMAILQGAKGGFWVHCEDLRFLYKSLQVGTADDARCLGFDTDAFGPIDNNISAGGLAWRINVYDGDWKIPAARYREWMRVAYQMDKRPRPAWEKDIKFALAWCPIDLPLLDELAKRIAPNKILLHVTAFRKTGRSQGYPDFTPTPEGAAFIKKAQAMGFHVTAHCPALDIDPRSPEYELIRDFQYRELENKKIIGWTWRGEGPVPESNNDRQDHKGQTVNMRLHGGSSMWRSILAENILALAEAVNLDSVFLDVTMNNHNVYNCFVENYTPTTGMMELIRTMGALGKGLVVTGEGRNEIVMQDEAFGQVHLFKSWHENLPGLEKLKTCPLGEFMFGPWCRAFGYNRLTGRTPAEEFRMKMQLEQGSVPTITIRSADEIRNPNAGVKLMLDLAAK